MPRLTKALPLILSLALLACAALAGPAQAAEPAANPFAPYEQAFKNIMSDPQHAIPASLLAEADAVAIFADVTKAGLVIGGMAGDGVVVPRTKDGFGAPAFYRLEGLSVGAQIGAEFFDTVLLFLSPADVEHLTTGTMTLGAGASYSAGPDAGSAQGQSAPQLEAGVLSYLRTRQGVFAGASLKGDDIDYNADKNAQVYGKSYTAAEMLLHPMLPVPTEAKGLIDAIKAAEAGK